MLTISLSNPTIYAGYADEILPDPKALQLADGSMFVILQGVPPQVWIVRNGAWVLLMPADLSVNIPLTPIFNAAVLAGSAGPTSAIQRQIVALGGSVNAVDPSYLDQMSIRIEDSLNAILVEMRLLNLQMQGLSTFPVLDDLDSLRPTMLDPSETTTR